jgi:aurora kinase, other
LGRGKFG